MFRRGGVHTPERTKRARTGTPDLVIDAFLYIYRAVAIVSPATRMSGRSTRPASRMSRSACRSRSRCARGVTPPLATSSVRAPDLYTARRAAAGHKLVADRGLLRDARRDEDETEHERRDRRRAPDGVREPGGRGD